MSLSMWWAAESSMDNSVNFESSIVCFLNRPLGEKVLNDLMEKSDLKVNLVVLHDEGNRDFGALAESTVVSWNEFTFDWLPIHYQQSLFTHGISVLFGHRLPPEVLGLCRHGVLNCHPSFLPFGRGAHPAAWAIWKGEPYGATLHLMEDTLDTGPILDQVSIPVHLTDTSASLYAKGLLALWDLYLASALPWLRGQKSEFHPQQGVGSSYTIADLESLTNIELTSSMALGRALQLLRARTFGARDGAHFQISGEHYGVTVHVYNRNDVVE